MQKKKYGENDIVVYKSNFYNMFFSLNANYEEREKSLFKIICRKSDSERIVGIHAHGRAIDEIL
jgi:pyruvate/2-oxoglutarate dehydrogenase complex dihydrolipoamide dehydrogenase (E3) component